MKRMLGKLRFRRRVGQEPTSDTLPAQSATLDPIGSLLQTSPMDGTSQNSQHGGTQGPADTTGTGPESQAQGATIVQQQTAGSNDSSAASTDNDTRQLIGCWNRAMDKLVQEEQDIIKQLGSESPPEPDENAQQPATWVRSLLNECQDLQKRHASERSQWIIHFFEQDLSVRKLLDTLIDTLSKVLTKTEKAAQLAVSVDPVHAVAPYLLLRSLVTVYTPYFSSLVIVKG